MWLEREIRQKLQDTIELMLKGGAADYVAYASIVARYRALKELVDLINDRKEREIREGEILDDE